MMCEIRLQLSGLTTSPRAPARRRRGATAVEMALVTPLFLLIVFGLVEFSRIIMFKHALRDAARLGCRKAVLATTIDDNAVDQAIREHLQAFMSQPADCRISISPGTLGQAERGTDVTTLVEVDYSQITFLPPMFVGDHVVRNEVTMKRE